MLRQAQRDDFSWMFALMEQSFPPTEMRKEEGQKAVWENPKFQAWAEEQKRGFLTCWQFKEGLYLEHFAVDPSQRGTGLGSKILKEFLEKAQGPVFFEVELPQTEMARRRIGFYERLGCVLNDYPYLQPPYRTEEGPIPMLMMSYPAPLTAQEFEANKEALYTQVYGRRP